MSNLYREFMALMPARPLEVGDVTAINGSVATITLPGGGVIHARGAATVGQRVFVRDGAIEGQAPALTYVQGEA
ncbi:hypothetical protein [Acidovorax soli]|uniref:hypothetical protein n=1 Tax=Acidovorax soli TaxID=592050 RepID=UPI0032B294C1